GLGLLFLAPLWGIRVVQVAGVVPGGGAVVVKPQGERPGPGFALLGCLALIGEIALVVQGGVVGEVGCQHIHRALGQLVLAQQMVGLGHDGQGVGHRGGLLEIFHHIAAAVGRRHIGAALEVVVGGVNFVLGQQVSQKYHALAGVGGVAAVGVQGEQLAEGAKGLPRGPGIAAGEVGGNEVVEKGAALLEVGQALDVVGVVHIGVARVEADKAVGGGDGGLVVGGAVVGVNQLQLGLLGVGAKGELGLQGLEVGDGIIPAAAVEVALDNVVEVPLGIAFGFRGGFLVVVILAEKGYRGATGKCQRGQQEQRNKSHKL